MPPQLPIVPQTDAPSSATPIVALYGVTVVRSGRTILEGVDWEIGPGESWVLFGANGSGKTTLMEVVSTYLFPTKGSVEVLGQRMGKADVRELRPRIGYVGPAPAGLVRQTFRALDIVVTGRHASFVGTRWHRYEEEDWARAESCLRDVQAGDLAEREFASLSEGEKKRVLIARSLMTSPDLLLLDEPGSGLDLGARERLVDSLSRLAADGSGRATVLVTHHVEEIPPGFRNILMLGGGRVVASGPLDEVLTSDTLSATFDLPLHLERRGERWRAWSDGARR